MKQSLKFLAGFLLTVSMVGCCYRPGYIDPATGMICGGGWEPVCGGPLDPFCCWPRSCPPYYGGVGIGAGPCNPCAPGVVGHVGPQVGAVDYASGACCPTTAPYASTPAPPQYVVESEPQVIQPEYLGMVEQLPPVYSETPSYSYEGVPSAAPASPSPMMNGAPPPTEPIAPESEGEVVPQESYYWPGNSYHAPQSSTPMLSSPNQQWIPAHL